jgi:hypothetical protein
MRIGFTGDVSFSGGFSGPEWTAACVAPVVREFLNACDHIVVNLEGPLTPDQPKGGDGVARLSSPPHHVNSLRDLGCTILNLANNHVLDCGPAGLDRTLAVAGEAGLLHQGAGASREAACAPLVVASGGVSVALLAMTVNIGQAASRRGQGTCSGLLPRECRAVIRRAKGLADRVVVQYHGGDEFVPLPSRRQIRLLRSMIDWGADVVICHHAHVVQPYEQYRSGLIFYGLGNFIFDIPAHRGYPGTEGSVIVRLSMTASEVNFDYLRTTIDRRAFTVEGAELDDTLPGLPAHDYRFRYGQAVYDAHFWPQIQRGPSGAPDAILLRTQREPLWRGLLNPGRVRARLKALVHPAERAQLLAMLEYRLRRQWREWRRKQQDGGLESNG